MVCRVAQRSASTKHDVALERQNRIIGAVGRLLDVLCQRRRWSPFQWEQPKGVLRTELSDATTIRTSKSTDLTIP